MAPDDKKGTDSSVNTEKNPLDGAVNYVKGSVGGAVHNAQSLVSDNVKNGKDMINGQVAQVQELTSSARIAIKSALQSALNQAKGVVRPVVQVFEQAEGNEGTELRKHISSLRISANHQLYDVQQKLQETQKVADNQVFQPLKSTLAFVQSQLETVNTFRRNHPEAAMAGLITVVGVPSMLLRGKLVAARNVLVVVGAGAGVAYTSDILEKKK